MIFTNFGEQEALASMKAIKQLRANGITAEIYPDSSKMKKQMAYANALNIPYVAIIGDSELAEGKVTLKNMTTGEQATLDTESLIAALKK